MSEAFPVQDLLDKLHYGIKRSLGRQGPEVDHEIQAGLKELRDSLQLILPFYIPDRLKQISNDCREDWLWRLKDFFYTTEDVLDDLDFIDFSSHKWPGDGVSAFEDMHFMGKFLEVIETAVGLYSEIKELKKSKPVCSDLDQQINTSLGLRTLPYQVRKLKGRSVEKEKILEALLHGESTRRCPKLIWITGPVGTGKTDLARVVYNSEEVEAEFNVRAWIYMGIYQEDDKWLTLQRSESASVDQLSKLHRSSSFFGILHILEEAITGKKALIVLDNISNMKDFLDFFESNMLWDRTRERLVTGIIVTTQLDNGYAIDMESTVELDGLEEEEYLELFKESALGDRNRNEHPELEDIVGEIAKRFGGNPLAAVTIGRHLKWHQSEDRWRLISRSNLGMIDPTESNIISVLRHSYDKLLAQEKQFYLTCALFPKNYPFEKDQLLAIVKAVGCDSCIYLGCLLQSSFFVSSARKKGKFVLHPILHELADHICDGEFFRLEDEIEEEDDIEIPDKARHVYVTADDFVKVHRVLQEKTHLRSLVICGVLSSEEHKLSFMGLLEEVLRNLNGLRLLIISVLPTGKLPDAIGGLRHLRHLELPISQMMKESITKLSTWISDQRFRNLTGVRDTIIRSPITIQVPSTVPSTHPLESINELLSWKPSYPLELSYGPSSRKSSYPSESIEGTSSWKSGVPSVLRPLKLSVDDIDLFPRDPSVLLPPKFSVDDIEVISWKSRDPSVRPPLKFSEDDTEVLSWKSGDPSVLPPLKFSEDDTEVLSWKSGDPSVLPRQKFSEDDTEVLQEEEGKKEIGRD